MSQVPRDLGNLNDPFVGPMSVQGQTPGSAQSSISNIQLGINTPGMGIGAQTQMVGQFPSASGFAFPGGGQTPGLGQLSYYGMGLQSTGMDLSGNVARAGTPISNIMGSQLVRAPNVLRYPMTTSRQITAQGLSLPSFSAPFDPLFPGMVDPMELTHDFLRTSTTPPISAFSLIGQPIHASQMPMQTASLAQPGANPQIIFETYSFDEIERAREKSRVNVLRINLNEKFDRPDQQLKLVSGLGVAFIHGRTGTLYFNLNENNKIFQNKTGYVYIDFRAQEDPVAYIEYDPRQPRVHLELPNDASALNDEMFLLHWWLDRTENSLPFSARGKILPLARGVGVSGVPTSESIFSKEPKPQIPKAQQIAGAGAGMHFIDIENKPGTAKAPPILQISADDLTQENVDFMRQRGIGFAPHSITHTSSSGARAARHASGAPVLVRGSVISTFAQEEMQGPESEIAA